MKRQTKLVAVLSASALLVLGASVTSMAATRGWVEENGSWEFLDSDGYAVTEEWKKSGNHYFWLDQNGEMAANYLVDDGDHKYYVDDNGARVINRWVQVDNDDSWTNGDNDEEPESVWYYFGSTGKANTGKKTINGKTYIFDETGEMFSGWTEHSSKNYYLGGENEGFAYTGWHYLEMKEDIKDNERYDGDEEGWFYFKSSGEMRKGTDEKLDRAYINGSYYGFDDNGVMVDGWVPPKEATATEVAYYTEDIGNQPKGWVITSKNTEEGKNEDPVWFYLNSKGKPFNAGGSYSDDGVKKSEGAAQKFEDGYATGEELGQVASRVIKSKTYLFDNTGEMLEGVYQLSTSVIRVGGAGNLEEGFYYFNKADGGTKGQMAIGKTTVNQDGENYYYYFNKSGKAYANAIVDGTIYKANGIRLNADESKMLYTINAEDFDADKAITDNKSKLTLNVDDAIIVSSSGKVTKNGTVTIDGTKFKVVDYKVTNPQGE